MQDGMSGLLVTDTLLKGKMITIMQKDLDKLPRLLLLVKNQFANIKRMP